MPQLRTPVGKHLEQVRGVGPWARIEIVGIDRHIVLVVYPLGKFVERPSVELRSEGECTPLAADVIDRNARPREKLAARLLAGFVEIDRAKQSGGAFADGARKCERSRSSHVRFQGRHLSVAAVT